MKNKRQSRIFEKAAEVFDLPSEAAAGVARVTVTGNGRVHIENHRGLLNYGTEEISLNAGRFVIRLRGTGLEIVAMSDLELVVKGEVISLEYLV